MTRSHLRDYGPDLDTLRDMVVACDEDMSRLLAKRHSLYQQYIAIMVLQRIALVVDARATSDER